MPGLHTSTRSGFLRLMLRRGLLVLLALGLGLAAVPPRALAADAGAAAIPSKKINDADTKLRKIEEALKAREPPSSDDLRAFLGDIPNARDIAARCIDENQGKLDTVDSNLQSLGSGSPQEAAGVQQQRGALRHQKRQIEQQLQICRVLRLRANDLLDRVTSLRQQRLAARLMHREASAWVTLRENLAHPEQWWSTAKLFVLRDSGIGSISLIEAVGLAGLILVCIGGALYARQPMFELSERMRGGPTMTAGFLQALVACAASVLPALVTSIAAAVYLTVIRLDQSDWAFVTLLSYGLAGYFVVIFLIRLFLAPCPPAHAYLPAPEPVLRSLARRLRTLAILVLAVTLFSATLVVEGFPEPVQQFLRLLFSTVLIIVLIRIIWLAGNLLKWHDTRVPRLLLVAAMLFALGAEWSGYLYMAQYVVGGVVGTLLSFGLAWFVWRLFDDLYDGLDEGRRRWQRRLREGLGVQPNQYMPGLIWLRVLTAIVVWGGFGLLVLLMWGLSDTGLAFLVRTLNEGVKIGRFEVVPIKLFWGMVVLIVLIGITGWFKQRLGQRWLTRTRMERGAREAVVTVTGYSGIGIAIFMGLAIAGVQFTNIAIIAGALSVGIGFGLQNIFNNFVSGLILLFERPVKTDDWIVVGNTEGLVKKISIRSTQIQTFDHADVIVPNSEIIQGQVTNWMLRDPFGRVIVPVTTAYDCDPQDVHDILLSIGQNHPRVITDAVLAPAPIVLLRGFGDYGMQFELRVFIRDVDYFLIVQSDINFAIEREFRAHGIVIPYPRQDIRLERVARPWQAERERRKPRPPGDTPAPDALGDGGGDGGGDA